MTELLLLLLLFLKGSKLIGGSLFTDIAMAHQQIQYFYRTIFKRTWYLIGMSTASNMTNNEESQACLATRQALITPMNFSSDYFPLWRRGTLCRFEFLSLFFRSLSLSPSICLSEVNVILNKESLDYYFELLCKFDS